jgi:hypothetical protein
VAFHGRLVVEERVTRAQLQLLVEDTHESAEHRTVGMLLADLFKY